MPNYSKTSIYKICCKDTTITDIYIGSTCNFSKRKYQHKKDCNNNSNIKVYQFIRDNGGWINWNMIQIKEFSCENRREKDTEERKCIEELKPTLNVNIPTRSKKEYYIDNKEIIKEIRKTFYLKNKDKLNEKMKLYNLENKEKLKKYKEEYQLKNKEKIKKRMKEYKLENKEKIKEYQKEYREKMKKK